MLNSIREAINNLPDTPFSELYQRYVASVQDSIIQHDVDLAEKDYTSLEDACQLIKGVNTIAKELKHNGNYFSTEV